MPMATIPKPQPTAKSVAVINCLHCGTVTDASASRCLRCNAPVHSRKTDASARTWLYLITTIILFFPANLLPITYTSYLGGNPSGDTIMSNIILLWHHGSYMVAAVIFAASIFTPFIKVAILLYLLTHQRPHKPPILQTKLYRFVHFIGRWSMIDVFVVALLGALIHGRLAMITPGAGIFAFAAVVVFSMLAAEAFDIRILWDNYREHYATSANQTEKTN